MEIQEIEIPKGKQILEETFVLRDYKFLEEGEGKEKKFRLRGTLGIIDEATANDRVYPRKVMNREIKKLKEAIAERKVYGELDHPGDGKTKLARVSHLVSDINIHEDKNSVDGELTFIPGTINGDQAIAIAKAGGSLGVSSRGFGSTVIDSRGKHIVQEDYNLITYDVVADPAAAGAYPSIVYENKEKMVMNIEELRKNHPELVTQIEKEIRDKVEPEARDHARNALREEFETKLLETSEKIKKEAVEEARENLLEDPEVAGAHTAMSEIVKVVSPFILSEDETGLVRKMQRKLAESEAKVAEMDEKIAELEEEAEELSELATEAFFNLYVEKSLSENDKRDQIEGMLGDVMQFESLDEIKERIAEIEEALLEGDKVQEEISDKVKKLEAHVEKLTEERDKAMEVGKKALIVAYAEKRIAGHPRAEQLREQIEKSAPETREEIDNIVSLFEENNPPSREYSKVRDYLDGKKKSLEEGKSRKSEKGGSVFGVSFGELKELSDRTN